MKKKILICLLALTGISTQSSATGFDDGGGIGIDGLYHYTCFAWNGTPPVNILYQGTTTFANLAAERDRCISRGGTHLLSGPAN